jgi:hypothetical protein
MEQKPFEVGEWVFDRREWRWSRIGVVFHKPNEAVCFEGSIEKRDPAWLSRDPHAEIPPKPKRMVMREAYRTATTFYLDGVREDHYSFPAGATYIKPPTYEVPED